MWLSFWFWLRWQKEESDMYSLSKDMHFTQGQGHLGETLKRMTKESKESLLKSFLKWLLVHVTCVPILELKTLSIAWQTSSVLQGCYRDYLGDTEPSHCRDFLLGQHSFNNWSMSASKALTSSLLPGTSVKAIGASKCSTKTFEAFIEFHVSHILCSILRYTIAF